MIIMSGKEIFLERFAEAWPGWRDDMEENIRYAERSGKEIFKCAKYPLYFKESNRLNRSKCSGAGLKTSSIALDLQIGHSFHIDIFIAGKNRNR